MSNGDGIPNDQSLPASSAVEQPEIPAQSSAAFIVEPHSGVSHDTGPQWLHPMSAFFDAIAKIYSMIFPLLLGGYAAFQGQAFGYVIAMFVVAFTLLIALIRYAAIRYQLQGDDLIVDEGIIFRNHRTIPVQRIQNIDLKQNLLHRLCKVAEVRIETASGDKPEAVLRVISLEKVDWLRQRVAELQRSRSLPTRPVLSTSTGEAPLVASSSTVPLATPAETILEIPLSQLLLAGALSNRGLIFVGVVFGLLFQGNWWEDHRFWRDSVRSIRDTELSLESQNRLYLAGLAIGALVLGILIVKLLSMAWYVLRFYGYRLQRTENEFHIRCGLLTQLSATIPRNRIQLISVQRSLLERRMGLATIRIETAGSTGKEDDASATIGRRWFVPVLLERNLPDVLAQLRPGMKWRTEDFAWQSLSPKTSTRLRRLAIAFSLLITIGLGLYWRPWGLTLGFVIVPACLWYAEKRAQSMKYAREENQVAFRSGVLVKKFSLSFMDKIQTVAVSQSPLDRRWEMATLAVDTASAGPANHRIVVRMLDAKQAQQEFQMLRKFASETKSA